MNNRHKANTGCCIATFVEVAPLGQIKTGTGTAVVVADHAVVIFNVDGALFATDDSCLRCGASLALGKLCGHHVACPRCDWRYDVITGSVHGVPRLHTGTFGVKIVNSHVLVCTHGDPVIG